MRLIYRVGHTLFTHVHIAGGGYTGDHPATRPPDHPDTYKYIYLICLLYMCICFVCLGTVYILGCCVFLCFVCLYSVEIFAYLFFNIHLFGLHKYVYTVCDS